MDTYPFGILVITAISGAEHVQISLEKDIFRFTLSCFIVTGCALRFVCIAWTVILTAVFGEGFEGRRLHGPHALG